MNYSIPLSKPYLTGEDLKELEECFASSWISSKSPWVEKFENIFAKKVSHTKYAVSVNSGTSALFLALKSVGIKEGDEVIIPSLTMIATASAVILTGAKPILVDCQSSNDWNINIEQTNEKITKRTKAIIPVHLYGYPCNIQALKKIAKEKKLFLIEDAAEATGSLYKKFPVGSIGDVGCFSLYSNKIITTGNGGMIVTNNKKIADTVRQLRFFAIDSKKHFSHSMLGYNLVLSGLQAAIGVSQVRRFEEQLKKRKEIFAWYTQLLKGNDIIKFISPLSNTSPNFWFPAVVFTNGEMMNKIKTSLQNDHIETREFFRPIHQQPVFKGVFNQDSYSSAEYFWKHGLLLPSYFELTKYDVERITDHFTREK